MSNQLLPCPFCGGEPVLKQYRADGLEIKCSSCRSGRQQRWLYKGKEWLEAKMIEKWNERAAPTVERQCSEVATQCSEQLRTQAIQHQPAPASVVLPIESDFYLEVFKLYGFGPDKLCMLDGKDLKRLWNACLDKIKELNKL